MPSGNLLGAFKDNWLLHQLLILRMRKSLCGVIRWMTLFVAGHTAAGLDLAFAVAVQVQG